MTSPDTEFINILGATSDAEAPATKISARSLPQVLPILGLSDIVIFPGMVAPLLVETSQSIHLIDDVVGGERLLGVVLQKKPEVENPLPEDMFEIGCAARVLKMLKFPDNTVRVLVEGLWRIRIKGYEAQTPYLKAKIEVWKDAKEDSIELQALTRNAHAQFQEIIKLSPAMADQVKIAALNTEDPGHLTDLIAVNLNLSLDERQKMLETNSVKERLTRLLPLLNREHEVLTLSSKIQTDVASSMSKTQRDFFLREQMRAIQRELGEGDVAATEIKNLREQIDKAPLPDDARKVAVAELERLQQMSPSMAEYGVARHYLDWILGLPWVKVTEDKINLNDAKRILDEQHFGLPKVKDRLLEFLAVIKLKKQIKGPILCLVGPPGVGKTSLGKSIADALGRKFARIALGGMRDEAEIRGHRRTYVGALPGRIIHALRRTESRNPVILLDEIDKVGSDFRGDPASALLEVLDPSQNNTFTDHYLDLPFDLSRVLFITTANWLDPIHPALRDRLEVIELAGYTESEKLQIAKRYLVPRQSNENGVTRKMFKIPDATLRRLIQDYTREAGVRQLEREIAALMRKAALKIVSQNGNAKSVTLAPKALADYLGPVRNFVETAEQITEIGIATGLAWTPVGGEILYIEATRMPGRGQLILTGSLGEVMKESAQTALSYLRSQSRALALDLSDYAKYDLHIHVPAGATPKDGPSAGVTIVVALASLLMRRRVRSDIAMTGEISLRGRVLRVGGIKEKVLAAARFGLTHVMLPEQNSADWEEVPVEVRKKMKVHFVSHISELIPLALTKK
ncbi:endopeptidase La [Pedosphaera parvula]|uniref:Lon protease n=1 Tax=Pedosphaera parvula (strain Ellin514) TaxID=320771 RepID=B9XSI5_PEDPL|nr:endopeptidase La [Pedosphaera parvula]EEF57185.1 ATP-dependent protease La [Pedosphaera parvula Ellin514]